MPITLNTSRFSSDRIVVQGKKLAVDKGNRFFTWLSSPKKYSDENRRAVRCIRKYLIKTLGVDRLTRICTRQGIHFKDLEKSGSAFTTRMAAKISIGVRDVSVEDINDLIQKAKLPSTWPSWIDKKWQKELSEADTFVDLDPKTFAAVRKALAKPFNWGVERIEGRITGRATERLSRFIYDPFLADRERLQLGEKHAKSSFTTFMNNTTVNILKREMEVGMIIPAPSSGDTPQFYYVAAKLLTGEGMVSYILMPTTQDSDLPPIRLFRGSAFRCGEIDALSTLITDLQEKLGLSSYESGEIYQPILDRLFNIPVVGGHSLGSTQAQFAVARDVDHRVRKAYFFNGPGLPLEEVESFNRRMRHAPHQLELTIRDSTKDSLSKLGQYVLGWEAPKETVSINYIKYHAPKEPVPGAAPHVLIYSQEPNLRYGSEGTHGSHLNEELDHTHQSSHEPIRSLIGPPLAWLVTKIRSLKRSLFSSRVEALRGLHLGIVQKNRYCRLHIPPADTPSFLETLTYQS